MACFKYIVYHKISVLPCNDVRGLDIYDSESEG